MLLHLVGKLEYIDQIVIRFNPFLVNIFIFDPLKTSKNLWFSGVFRGYEMGILTRNVLIH